MILHGNRLKEFPIGQIDGTYTWQVKCSLIPPLPPTPSGKAAFFPCDPLPTSPRELGAKSTLGGSMTNLIASAVVSPIYVVVTNPLSRLEVIMQTNAVKGKAIGVVEAVAEMTADMRAFGLRGVFRGQGIGIVKAILSLSLFHEGRMFLGRTMVSYNEARGDVYKGKAK